jgi:TRAP-type C4-dicarboxylate transport system permease small subunit
MFLQTQPAQLSKFTEFLYSMGILVALLIALYFGFKYFNKNQSNHFNRKK